MSGGGGFIVAHLKRSCLECGQGVIERREVEEPIHWRVQRHSQVVGGRMTVGEKLQR